MTGSTQPVVWIGVHDLGRAGVPIVLARLLGALPPEHRERVHVIAMRDGPLAAEMVARCASLTVLEPADRRSVVGSVSVGLGVLGAASAGRGLRRAAWGVRVARLPRPDVVLVHGAGAWPVAALAPRSAPVVVHLHELSTGLDRSIPSTDQRRALSSAARVMVVSAPVADLAIERGARSDRIEMVPGVVEQPPAAQIGPPPPSDDTRWVMGAGSPGWRKGTDRLAALAHPFVDARPEVRVGWVGGRPSGPDATAVAAADPVQWFDSCPDPWAVLRRSEVVVVPSREDPLPLVALEAGIRARPVVAMPTGGLADLLADGRGMVGRRHDVAWLHDAVGALLDRPDEARDMGLALREHVAGGYLATHVVPIWSQMLAEVADS